MSKPPIPFNEKERLNDLLRYQVLDSHPEQEFNELTTLASKICGTRFAMIAFIDSHRLWMKSSVGMDQMECPREATVCAYTICQHEVLVIADLSEDERFQQLPGIVDGPKIRFYAGVSLVSKDGHSIGTLCVQDTVSGTLTEDQKESLKVLGRQVVKQLELGLRNRQLEEAMLREQKQREEIEYLYSVQKRIASIIAHDVRNPLGSIASTIRMYENKMIDEYKLRMFIQLLDTQVNATLTLLNNLVEWGKIQLQEQANNVSCVPVAELIDRSFIEVRALADAKQIRLVNNIEPDLLVGIDRNVTGFAVRNLLTNALKFTEKGEVSVSACFCEEGLQFRVKDSGIGMSAAVVGQLFKTNERNWRKGTRNETGSGLGLLLVNEFIVKNGGSISVESTEGCGTCVSFVVRCDKAQNPLPAA